jgi:NAD(P)H-quinone oxidoreductase subunit 5
LALLFLLVHGLAKALLFMSVGSIITTTSTQDLTEMGGLASRMPATMIAFVIGGLTSIGLLPLGGFWVMLAWIQSSWAISPWLAGILLLVNGLTTFNLVRVFGLIFWGPIQPKTRRAPEVPWLMAVPMLSLAIFNLFVPALMQRLQLLAIPELMATGGNVAILLASSLVGAALGVAFYLNQQAARPVNLVWHSVREFLSNDFGIAQLYRVSVVLGVVQGARLTAWFDRYIVDGLVNFVGVASIFGGESLKYTISGQSRNYLLSLFVGLLLVLTAVGWAFLSWSLQWSVA